MEIIMRQNASCLGILDRSTGYYIRQRGNRFFTVRMKNFDAQYAKGIVDKDGHWLTISQFVLLAQIGNVVADIRVSGFELHCAILESRWTIPHAALEYKRLYTAAEVYELKCKYNL